MTSNAPVEHLLRTRIDWCEDNDNAAAPCEALRAVLDLYDSQRVCEECRGTFCPEQVRRVIAEALQVEL